MSPGKRQPKRNAAGVWQGSRWDSRTMLNNHTLASAPFSGLRSRLPGCALATCSAAVAFSARKIAGVLAQREEKEISAALKPVEHNDELPVSSEKRPFNPGWKGAGAEAWKLAPLRLRKLNGRQLWILLRARWSSLAELDRASHSPRNWRAHCTELDHSTAASRI